jgi:hypothetical protein
MNRTQFIKLAAAPKVKEITIEGGKAFIRRLSAKEVNEVISAGKTANGEDASDYGFTTAVIARGVCNEKGERIFGDTAEDDEEISKIPLPVLDGLTKEICKYSGISGGDDAKNVE